MGNLNVVRSSSLELLASALAERLRATTPSDPFAPARVVVGSRGMERWLRHRLAERLGVCANVAFPFPEAFLKEALGRVEQGPPAGEGTSAEDAWKLDTIAWAVLEAIPGLLAGESFAALRTYLGEPTAALGPREFELGRKIAELFNRYIAFRPDDVVAWGAGRLGSIASGARDQAWQAELWLAVQEALGDGHLASRARAAPRRLADAVNKGVLCEPIRLFGVSALPPLHLDLFAALTALVDVELYLLCPSDVAWTALRDVVGRDPSWRRRTPGQVARALRSPTGAAAGNPLLSSLGRVPRNLQIVLETASIPYDDVDAGSIATPIADAFPDPALGEAPSALAWLQADVVHARAAARQGSEAPRRLLPEDDSIQLHGCHGPTRQVEVLREALLGLFEAHPHLQPRDVVVLTPDIEAFAPLITAVFSAGRSERRDGDWGPTGAPRVPFEITDLSLRLTNPVADALLSTLELATGRVEASKVLDLMALEPVGRRFGLSAEDVVDVQSWVQASGIRWAMDEDQREEEGQPRDRQNTWRFGLERLLLGVVMADDGGLFRGVRPFDALEGEGTRRIGCLVDLCSTLFTELRELRAPRTVGDWVERLGLTVDRITGTSDEASWLTRQVREALSELGASAARARSARPVTVETIRAALTGRFELASGKTWEPAGAVSFCALRPMRCVPYRVVCFLGMDEGVFPRSPSGLAFDLTLHPRRATDADPRSEDRFVLLEALLSAREHLLVLYTGHDVRTNEQCAPAVPIAELRDVIDATFAAPRGGRAASSWLTIDHPLQPFSERCFRAVHRVRGAPDVRQPWSFDRRLLAGAVSLRDRAGTTAPFFAKAQGRSEGGPGDDPELVVELDDLIRFLKHPVRYLLNQRLGLTLQDEREDVVDREPVALSALERWKLKDQLLRARLEGGELEAVSARIRASGELPLGFAGEVGLERPSALIQKMLEWTRPWTGDPAAPVVQGDPVGVHVALDAGRLTGQLTPLRDDLLLSLELGSEKTKRLVGPWVRLLAWTACEPAPPKRSVVVLGAEAGGHPAVSAVGFRLDPTDPEERRQYALDRLNELVAIYRRGREEPIPLFEGSSMEFAKKLRGRGVKAPLEAVDLEGGLDGLDEARIAQLRAGYWAARSAWKDDYSSSGDSEELHVARVYEEPPMHDPEQEPVPLDLDFARLALRVFGPLREARHTKSKVAKWRQAETV